MNKHILLIYPPDREEVTTPEFPPLGLAYIASTIRREMGNAYKVTLWDLNLKRVTKERFKKMLLDLETEPDVIGIGGIVTVFNHFLWMSGLCKEIFPRSLLIAGGSLASTIPHLLFRHSPADLCVKGEGEHTVVEILRKLESGGGMNDMRQMRGIILRDEKGPDPVETPRRPRITDLDTLGIPAYDLIDVEQYAVNGIKNRQGYARDLPERILSSNNRHMSVMTARGCTGNCTFCYRQFASIGLNSAPFTKKHILFLHDTFGINIFSIADELFNVSDKRMQEMISCFGEIKELIPDFYFRVGGLRADLIDVESLRKMKKAGCYEVIYGLESGSQKMLDSMRKRVTVEQNRKAVAAAREAGLHCIPQFVIGLPGEDKRTLKETFDFIASVDHWSYLSLHKANAYPGSEIYALAKERGLIADELSYISTLAGTDRYPLQLADIPRETMQGMVRRFFLKRMIRKEGILPAVGFVLSAAFRKIRSRLKRSDRVNAGRRYNAQSDSQTSIALFCDDGFEWIGMILWSLVVNTRIAFMPTIAVSAYRSVIERLPILKGHLLNRTREIKEYLADYKHAWYDVNDEAIQLTVQFYSTVMAQRGNDHIVAHYNSIFATNRFEAYIKKEMINKIFSLLRDLHLLRLSGKRPRRIVVFRNPISEFVIEYMKKRYGVSYRVRWITPFWQVIPLFSYYVWLLKECIVRGFVFNKKKKRYAVSKEAAWGYYRNTMRDDIVVDHKKIKKEDMLVLNLDKKSKMRVRFFEESRRRGFAVASVPTIPINVTRAFPSLVYFYMIEPLRSYARCAIRRQMFLGPSIFTFHKKCFPVELFMNLYRIQCHISLIDYDDIAATMVFNKYGTLNTINHWSDLTFYKAYNHAFIAHNIYFVWGDIHYDYHSSTYFVDKKVPIGCIFKREVKNGLDKKRSLLGRIPNIRADRKIAVFFDSSFNNIDMELTDRFFLEYLSIIDDFCTRYAEITICLKPKSIDPYSSKLDQENRGHFNRLWDRMKRHDNFFVLDPSGWSIGNALAIADVSINMGMNSPATIALLCGMDAVYYDTTGDTYHPFAQKYMNTLVFDDRETLFAQIGKILEGKVRCKDIISEEDLRSYDAFPDDRAVERWIDHLHATATAK